MLVPVRIYLLLRIGRVVDNGVLLTCVDFLMRRWEWWNFHGVGRGFLE